MTPTTDIGPLAFPWPKQGFSEFLRAGGASAAGHSAISGWLGCPEQSRLRAAGIQRKSSTYDSGELDALAFGSLCHVLGAIRPVYGQDAVYQLLSQWDAELDPESAMKAKLLFRTYDQMFPLIADPFEYLGVESEVLTDIGIYRDTQPGVKDVTPCIRTVRYDAVVRLKGSGEIFSFEKKTMARSGASALSAYTVQAMIQQALWNANPALVEKYGTMRGVIFDCLIKTITPNVERVGPKYYSKLQQERALEYMRLPDDGGVRFTPNADGSFPRMLHACWGRWRPCQYIGICHDEAWGDYEDREGNTYAGA